MTPSALKTARDEYFARAVSVSVPADCYNSIQTVILPKRLYGDAEIETERDLLSLGFSRVCFIYNHFRDGGDFIENTYIYDPRNRSLYLYFCDWQYSVFAISDHIRSRVGNRVYPLHRAAYPRPKNELARKWLFFKLILLRLICFIGFLCAGVFALLIAAALTYIVLSVFSAILHGWDGRSLIFDSAAGETVMKIVLLLAAAAYIFFLFKYTIESFLDFPQEYLDGCAKIEARP